MTHDPASDVVCSSLSSSFLLRAKEALDSSSTPFCTCTILFYTTTEGLHFYHQYSPISIATHSLTRPSASPPPPPHNNRHPNIHTFFVVCVCVVVVASPSSSLLPSSSSIPPQLHKDSSPCFSCHTKAPRIINLNSFLTNCLLSQGLGIGCLLLLLSSFF